MPERLKHIITFDIEEWYHGTFTNFDYRSFVGRTDSRVAGATSRILDLLDDTGNRGTFFILGEIARDHPDLVREINRRGHEIASHFMHHDLVYRMNSEKFREELIKGVDTLEQTTGEKVMGFRAPSWSVNMSNTPWYWEILAEQNIAYSSSRFPVENYMYGDSSSPLFRHQVETGSGKIIEIPPSVFPFFGRKLPFSGGFYFRMLPKWIVMRGVRWYASKGQPVVFYLHPKEIDRETPSLPLNMKEKIIHRAGIKRCYAKLEAILRGIETISIAETIGLP
jgi:polysaccharide deacetylase family protein (PEP-CTERM system associated)